MVVPDSVSVFDCSFLIFVNCSGNNMLSVFRFSVDGSPRISWRFRVSGGVILRMVKSVLNTTNVSFEKCHDVSLV